MKRGIAEAKLRERSQEMAADWLNPFTFNEAYLQACRDHGIAEHECSEGCERTACVLRRLVEAAYREGFDDAGDDAVFPEAEGSAWLLSNSRTALNQHGRE